MEEFEEPFTWQQAHERYGEIPKIFVCVLGKARRFADGAPVSQLLHRMNVLPAIADNVCMGTGWVPLHSQRTGKPIQQYCV